MWITPSKQILAIAKIRSIESLDEVRTIKTNKQLVASRGVKRIYIFNAQTPWPTWVADTIYKDATNFYRGKQGIKGRFPISPAGSIYAISAISTKRFKEAHPMGVANIQAYMGVQGAVLCFVDTNGFFGKGGTWQRRLKESATWVKPEDGVLYVVIDSKEVGKRVLASPLEDPTIPL